MPHSILVVDDEPGILYALALAFSSEGYLVRTAANGREALRLHAESPADVIISDVMMPILSGHELIRELRGRNDTPVILMSAAAFNSDRRRGELVIAKPFNLDTLFELIEQTLQDPEQA